MNVVVINPRAVAIKLAHNKVVTDLVNEHGKSAVLKEEDLYKSDGTYKTWVQGIFMEEFDFYLNLLVENNDPKLLKD